MNPQAIQGLVTCPCGTAVLVQLDEDDYVLVVESFATAETKRAEFLIDWKKACSVGKFGGGSLEQQIIDYIEKFGWYSETFLEGEQRLKNNQ